MRLGMVGLGKMGANMARRLMRGGHEVVVTDLSADNVKHLAAEGAMASSSLDDFVGKLGKPRDRLAHGAGRRSDRANACKPSPQRMQAGDILIDGGNSYFKDDVRRSKQFKDKGHSLRGCRHQRRRLGHRARLLHDDRRPQGSGAAARPDLQDAGAGPRRHSAHSRARKNARHRRGGLHPLRPLRRRPLRQDGPQRHRIRTDAGLRRGLRHLPATPPARSCRKIIATISTLPTSPKSGAAAAWSVPGCSISPPWRWRRIPRSREYTGFVQDSGEGRWTIQAAIEEAVPVDVLSAALFARFRSRQEHTFAEKMLSAMRQKFGGHVEADCRRQDQKLPARHDSPTTRLRDAATRP